MKIVVPNVGPVGISDPKIYDGAAKREKEDVSGDEEFTEPPKEAEAEATNPFKYNVRMIGRRSINTNARIAHLITQGKTHAEASKMARAMQDQPNGVDYPLSADCRM